MTIARRLIVDANASGIYHCIDRCVRKAYLCGDTYDYRRRWIRERMIQFARVFSLDLLAYAILSNHLHQILRTNPQRANGWSDREVAGRFLRLYPGRIDMWMLKNPGMSRRTAKRQVLENLLGQPELMALWRQRLGSLSWYKKLLKQTIARRANIEDNCTGHFWEARYRSYRLLTVEAVLSNMAYVDLNIVRAGIADSLADSEFASVIERLKYLERWRRSPKTAEPAVRDATSPPRHRGKTIGLAPWLVPIEEIFDITTEQYVQFVAAAGGVPIEKSSGADTKGQPPDAHALGGVNSSTVGEIVTRTKKWFGTAVGQIAALHEETMRRREITRSTKRYKRINSAIKVAE